MPIDGDSEKVHKMSEKVLKMTEKVPELSEKVLKMTEKVPELSEKIIKMTEKVSGQSLQCPDCELSFKDARKLDNHHKMVHLVTWLIFR